MTDIAELKRQIAWMQRETDAWVKSPMRDVAPAYGVLASLRELLALREQQEWVPYSRGDNFPPDGRYIVTYTETESKPAVGSLFADSFDRWGVTAYLPRLLPSPYTESKT